MKRSIFNDVIGPLTRGPSSSHTGASYFIGKIARDLFGREIKRIKIQFDENGSYAQVYRHQNSEFGFLSGLLNIPMESDDFFNSKKICEEKEVKFQFRVTEIPQADHPNVVLINLSSKQRECIEVRAKSTGGGTFSVDKINGWGVSIDGQSYEILIEYPAKIHEKIQNLITNKLNQPTATIIQCKFNGKQSEPEPKVCLQIKSPDEIGYLFVKQLKSIPNVVVWSAKPIFFVMKGEQLFSSAKECLSYSKRNNKSLGEVALDYESKLVGISKEEVVAEMKKRLKVMLKSVESGLETHVKGLKLLDSTAHLISANSKKKKLFSNSPNSITALRAMASMEISSSGGYICAAPTGGSSGVIPAVMYTLKHDFGIDNNKLVLCALAAGGIGVIHAIRSTFAAEVAGCQVEIGIAGAMAAAAVCEAANTSCKDALDAAAISLQNTMGSICDLVGGICEIPCHTRNAISASNAFVCADLIIGGYLNQISLDDTIDASDASGKMLPSELRCTARGGIAVTPSAKKIYTKKEEENNN